MNNIEYEVTRAMMNETQGIIDIPLQFHILRPDNGVGGYTYEFLMEQIDGLNDIFLSANIRFIHPNRIHYIDNTQYYNQEIMALGEETVFAHQYDISNMINIYCLENFNFAGLAYMPQQNQLPRILMNNVGFDYKTTFPHEIGHFFGLYHTHMSNFDRAKNQQIIEPIHRQDKNNNGVKDCHETGDYCCDTPADPNLGLSKLSNYISKNCQLSRPIPMDGKEYFPQIKNLMSYNPNKQCRTLLTKEQAARVYLFAKKERKKLRLSAQATGAIIKGEVKFYLKNQQWMPTSLDGVNLYRFDEAYSEANEFYFEINNLYKERIYVSIINMDGKSQKVAKIYPFLTQGDKAYISAQTTLNPMEESFIALSALPRNTTVKEYICILFSLSPIHAEDIAQKMDGLTGNFTNRLYKALGQQLLPLDNVNYRDGATISFEGTVLEGEILPVMLEMNHLGF